VLERQGYAVEVTGDAREARSLISRGVDVLVIGVNFPPAGCAAVLDMCGTPPPTVVIGEQGERVDQTVIDDPRVDRVLDRPYTLAALLESLEAAMDARPG